MDAQERVRRAKLVLENLTEEITRARVALEAVTEAASLSALSGATSLGEKHGAAIAEYGAMFEDAMSGVDLAREGDREFSRTRKVRRALGYTVP